VAYADEQPGLVFIRTIVSNDRLSEAEHLIEDAIKKAKDKITEADLEHARNALVNSLVDNFESNDAMAQAFLFIDRFGLPADYFDNRLHNLKSISLDDIKDAVGQVLDAKNLIKLKVGRVN
jgi:predicted Zn-dependent peptidase